MSHLEAEPVAEPSLSSWEEEGGEEDGVEDGDLITWDEVEIMSELEKPGLSTPVRAVAQTFTICATPSLAERVSMLELENFGALIDPRYHCIRPARFAPLHQYDESFLLPRKPKVLVVPP